MILCRKKKINRDIWALLIKLLSITTFENSSTTFENLSTTFENSSTTFENSSTTFENSSKILVSRIA